MNKIHLIQFQSRKGVALEYRKLNNRVKLLGEKIGKSTLNWTMKIKNQVTAKAIKGNRKFLWWFWSIQRPLDHQSPAVKKTMRSSTDWWIRLPKISNFSIQVSVQTNAWSWYRCNVFSLTVLYQLANSNVLISYLIFFEEVRLGSNRSKTKAKWLAIDSEIKIIGLNWSAINK